MDLTCLVLFSSTNLVVLSNFWRTPIIQSCSTSSSGLFNLCLESTYWRVVAHVRCIFALMSVSLHLLSPLLPPTIFTTFWAFFSLIYLMATIVLCFLKPSFSLLSLMQPIQARRSSRGSRIVALLVFPLVEVVVTMSSGRVVSCHVLTLVDVFCLCCDLAIEISLYCISIFMASLYNVPALMADLWLSYSICDYL